jgi:hypothetical protein
MTCKDWKAGGRGEDGREGWREESEVLGIRVRIAREWE